MEEGRMDLMEPKTGVEGTLHESARKWVRTNHASHASNMNISVTYVKCIDPSSKRVYYFNKLTHEAQWKLPQGVTDSDESPLRDCEDPTICNYVLSARSQ